MSVSTCIFPGCTHVHDSRGLCSTHVGIARDLIRQGLTTWAELEFEGLAKPRGSTNARKGFIEELTRRRSEHGGDDLVCEVGSAGDRICRRPSQ